MEGDILEFLEYELISYLVKPVAHQSVSNIVGKLTQVLLCS